MLVSYKDYLVHSFDIKYVITISINAGLNETFPDPVQYKPKLFNSASVSNVSKKIQKKKSKRYAKDKYTGYCFWLLKNFLFHVLLFGPQARLISLNNKF